MLTKRIIPCLDCKNGRVVKGVQFQNLVDAGMPSELALGYQNQGADEVVLLDIGASIDDRENQLETVCSVRKVLSIPLTVGGGIRKLIDIENLLNAGADKVSINTAAVLDPSLIIEAVSEFGSQCIVVAIDAKRKTVGQGWQVLTRSGTTNHTLDVLDWAQHAAQRGAGEILLTSFDRDGTSSGYDLELLESVSRCVAIPIIASGGAKTSYNLKEAFQSGADAVLAASMFHFGSFTIQKVKEDLKNLGVEVRI